MKLYAYAREDLDRWEADALPEETKTLIRKRTFAGSETGSMIDWLSSPFTGDGAPTGPSLSDDPGVHLEMRDIYTPDDPDFADWRAGVPFDPATGRYGPTRTRQG